LVFRIPKKASNTVGEGTGGNVNSLCHEFQQGQCCKILR